MAEWILTTDNNKYREYCVRTAEYIAKVSLNPLSVRLSICALAEEDDGNVIDLRISRKMISGRVRDFINGYITSVNIRYKIDIPSFEIKTQRND